MNIIRLIFSSVLLLQLLGCTTTKSEKVILFNHIIAKVFITNGPELTVVWKENGCEIYRGVYSEVTVNGAQRFVILNGWDVDTSRMPYIANHYENGNIVFSETPYWFNQSLEKNGHYVHTKSTSLDSIATYDSIPFSKSNSTDYFSFRTSDRIQTCFSDPRNFEYLKNVAKEIPPEDSFVRETNWVCWGNYLLKTNEPNFHELINSREKDQDFGIYRLCVNRGLYWQHQHEDPHPLMNGANIVVIVLNNKDKRCEYVVKRYNNPDTTYSQYNLTCAGKSYEYIKYLLSQLQASNQSLELEPSSENDELFYIEGASRLGYFNKIYENNPNQIISQLYEFLLTPTYSARAFEMPVSLTKIPPR